MKPEQFAEMKKTGKAPCGCAVSSSRDEGGREQRSCLHGEDCALKAKAKAKKSP